MTGSEGAELLPCRGEGITQMSENHGDILTKALDEIVF
jgi:hypothetical protein